MESYNSRLYEQDQEEEEDTLSLCDLPLDHNEEEPTPAMKASDSDDFFEFPVDPVYGYYPMDILFCGKSIHPSSNPNKKKQLASLESFKLGHCPPSIADYSHVNHVTQRRTTSMMRSKSSNKSHNKHLLMGLVKCHQQEMDLSEMRKRQGRRAPVAMFPVNVDGEKKLPEGKNEEELGVVVTTTRPLRCRSHLLSALAKAALGCVPHV